MNTVLHDAIYKKVSQYKWNLNKLPHESNNNHLGYGDVHISLLSLHKPKNILAIGSHSGFIPAILGMTAKTYGGQIDFVDANYSASLMGKDAHGGDGLWTQEYQQYFINTFDLCNTIQFHIETTRQFFAHNSKQYQYIYLDGDHSYDGVSYDFEQARLCSGPGSFITLHDAKVDDGWRGYRFGVGTLLKSLMLPYIIVGSFPGLAIIQI
jgi:hypothetical protein